MATAKRTPTTMMLALFMLAEVAQPSARPTATIMPARATVRILSGARVQLGPTSTALMVKASVRVEDGQRRPAYLIEFE